MADLVPGAAVLVFDRVQPLADFLDVAQARLFHLPLPAQVLKLLFDLADLGLNLGQPFERMLFLFMAEHSLGKLELKQPALEDVDLGRHRLKLHRQPAGRLVDQVDRLVRQEPSVMYRADSLAAVTSAESLILTLWWISYRSLRPRRIAIVSSIEGSPTNTG